MAPVQQYLIAARFVTTMGHFIALLLLFSTIENNIHAGLDEDYTTTERETANKIAWVIYSNLIKLVKSCWHSYVLFLLSLFSLLW